MYPLALPYDLLFVWQPAGMGCYCCTCNIDGYVAIVLYVWRHFLIVDDLDVQPHKKGSALASAPVASDGRGISASDGRGISASDSRGISASDGRGILGSDIDWWNIATTNAPVIMLHW